MKSGEVRGDLGVDRGPETRYAKIRLKTHLKMTLTDFYDIISHITSKYDILMFRYFKHLHILHHIVDLDELILNMYILFGFDSLFSNNS